MNVRPSAQGMTLQERLESYERGLADSNRKLEELQRESDRYERTAVAAEARPDHSLGRVRLNQVGLSLAVAGTGVAIVGVALGGAPVIGLGVATGLTGAGSLGLSAHLGRRRKKESMEGATARVSQAELNLRRRALESHRDRLAEAVRSTREEFEALVTPLERLLEPPSGDGVQERGQGVVIGGVVVPRRGAGSVGATPAAQ